MRPARLVVNHFSVRLAVAQKGVEEVYLRFRDSFLYKILSRTLLLKFALKALIVCSVVEVVNQENAMASFVTVPPESDFPIQNLPYGVFTTKNNVSLPCSSLGNFCE